MQLKKLREIFLSCCTNLLDHYKGGFVYNNVQLAIIKIWCKRHRKDFESGGLEWIRLYARTFRQIMNNTIDKGPGYEIL